MKLNSKNDEGFTFVETLVTLAIITILTLAVGISAVKYIDRARITSCKTQIETFKMALQSYYIDCGKYPGKAQGLEALWKKPIVSPIPTNWSGPYVDSEIPTDPWGTPYVYIAPGENGLPYEIRSYGADGKEGGDGIDADIISWKR